MAGAGGLEPPTFGFKVRCATNCAMRLFLLSPYNQSRASKTSEDDKGHASKKWINHVATSLSYLTASSFLIADSAMTLRCACLTYNDASDSVRWPRIDMISCKVHPASAMSAPLR